jgi:methyl-accepting chemotaxis protein
MFGFRSKRKGPQAEPLAPAVVADATAAAAAPPGRHISLLQQWMSIAGLQQRVIETLASEITRTSDFVETEADSLSMRFQRLADSARQQTQRVDSLTELAVGIDVEGKMVRIDQVAKLFEGTLSEVVDKILLLAKDSTDMVFALDSLGTSIRNVGKCNAGIDEINRTLNMLALNARIEGERAGHAGAAFRVVADEVYELSKSTRALAETMKTELKVMTDGITCSHDKLKRVATVDLSDDILVKERLERLLRALVHRNDGLSHIVADALKESQAISDDVGGMITGIQFQDRTKQRLEHVVDTLQVLANALEEIKSNTAREVPDFVGESALDTAWIKHLLARYTMTEMRERFVAQMLDGQPVDWGDGSTAKDGPSSSGSIELF